MDTDIANIELIAKQVVSLLRTRIPITKAYLFGSHIEGKTHEDNDIDIAIFSPVADNMNFEEKVELIVKAEKQINAPVELHLFGTTSLEEARLTNFFGYLCTHGKPID